MARSVAWRRQATDAASWHQDEALNATIYILREMGPTGFLLKEEGENKKHKVFLGDPHTCTCPVFTKEKDLCKHICWVILKKFRVPRQNQITWQLGLVEREITEILKGLAANKGGNTSAASRQLAKKATATEGGVEGEEEGGTVKQRPIAEKDVCPICQDEFLAKHLPVTYCKFGCGNSIHIKCMKVWADHQKTQGETIIKCPLCREDFGPFSLLQEEARNSSVRNTRAERLGQHLGATCKKCRVSPIVGKCYKCTICADYHLCQNCFITPTHTEHNFEFREKPNQRWQAAQRGTGSVLPSALVNAMMTRDLGDQDYEMLLQLDSQAAQAPSDLSQETVQSFPIERIRKNGLLLAPGQQCLVCLQAYSEGQTVRRLPCKHKFHKECIDNWLLHQHATCPVDGTVYTNQSVRAFREAQTIRQQPQRQNSGKLSRENQVPREPRDDLMLEIPGQGLTIQGSRPSCNSGMLRSGSIAGNAAGVTNQQDPAFAISGVSLANKVDFEPSSSPNSGSPVALSPLMPVPPSIPRPHNGTGHLSIRSHIDRSSPTDSPNSRPPSGQQIPGGIGRTTGRVRGRVHTNHASTRTRSGSLARSEGRDPSPGGPLYIGQDHAELLLTEPSVLNRTASEPSRLRIASHRPQNATRRNNIESNSCSSDLNKPTGDLNNLFPNGDSDIPGSLAGLHVGNSPLPMSPGHTGRLRTGHVAAACPREQAQSMGSPSRMSPAHSGSPLNKNSLYIGADPTSTEGCLRNFILNSIAQKNNVGKIQKKTPKTSDRNSSRDSEHRWGEVREMSGRDNDFVLSGNAVNIDGEG